MKAGHNFMFHFEKHGFIGLTTMVNVEQIKTQTRSTQMHIRMLIGFRNSGSYYSPNCV